MIAFRRPSLPMVIRPHEYLGRRGRPAHYPIEFMEVGDYFDLPPDREPSVRNAVSRRCRKRTPDHRYFTIQRLPDAIRITRKV
jgi:hypothetical protein